MEVELLYESILQKQLLLSKKKKKMVVMCQVRPTQLHQVILQMHGLVNLKMSGREVILPLLPLLPLLLLLRLLPTLLLFTHLGVGTTVRLVSEVDLKMAINLDHPLISALLLEDQNLHQQLQQVQQQIPLKKNQQKNQKKHIQNS